MHQHNQIVGAASAIEAARLLLEAHRTLAQRKVIMLHSRTATYDFDSHPALAHPLDKAVEQWEDVFTWRRSITHIFIGALHAISRTVRDMLSSTLRVEHGRLSERSLITDD